MATVPTPSYVQYTVRPDALTALVAASDALTSLHAPTGASNDVDSNIVSDQSVIPYDDMGHRSTPMSATVRQLVAAAVPGQTPGAFRIVRRAMSARFEALHPRGADGRFINKGATVKWRSSTSGLWQRGTVDNIHTDGTADVTDSSGVKSKRAVKTLYAAQEAVAKLSPSNFTMVQGQGGSNSGAFFQDPKTGDVWYVKTPTSADHVSNEVAATKLYGLAGVAVPEIKTSPDGKKFLSKVENSEGWYQLSDSDKANAREDIRRNFMVDAWLGNYDAPRNDNIRVTDEGVPIRVDTGGALKYRARGSLKPKLPQDMSAEIAKLRQQSAYKGLTSVEEEDAVRRILAISPDDVKDAVKTAGLDPTIADDLIARRSWLATTYGYQLPETTPAGKAALAARAAVYGNAGGGNGANNGTNSVGAGNSSGNSGSSVSSAPTLAQAVRKRDATTAAPLAPGSSVWLRKKPTPPAGEAKYPDTWEIDSVAADGQTVALKTGKGRQLTVPVASIEVLRDNKASVNSKFATGEQPSIGDRIGLDLQAGVDPKTHPGDGEITELYPMYARVKMDNGSSKVVAVKKLSLVPDKGSSASSSAATTSPAGTSKAAANVSPSTQSDSALYATPYDGNTHQNDYIKQAETLIRAGSFQLKTFVTDAVYPTQSEAQTQGTGSGRGAKDLGPIVARINGKDYLLDGHHRAYNSSKIKAQYVDLDAEGITGTKSSKPSPKTNPKGVPFDFSAHDFTNNPNPIGYSLTHNSPVAYVGKALNRDGTVNDRDIVAILPNKGNPKDPIPVRIKADNFRSLTSVDHDALTNKPAASKNASKVNPKDFTTLDEAKTKLTPVPIPVKYPSAAAGQHTELYQMQAGDRVFDIRRSNMYSKGIGGIYLFRDGKVHYLGSNIVGDTRSSYFSHRKPNDTEDNAAVLISTLSETGPSNVTEISDKLAKKDSALFAKAAKLANVDRDDLPVDFESLLPTMMDIVDPNGKHVYTVDHTKVPWPSWLSHNIQSYTLKTDGPQRHKDSSGNSSQLFPSFVYDKDNDKMYYIGDTDMEQYSFYKEKNFLPPDQWTELTQAQRDFYFDTSGAKATGAGTGRSAKIADTSNDVMVKRTPLNTADTASSVPANAAIRNSRGELMSRKLASQSYRSPLGYTTLYDSQVSSYKTALALSRGERVSYHGLTKDAFKYKAGASTGANASMTANDIDPNATPPKPGDVLPKHRNPYVESKVSPIQALNYSLPTSRTTLDDGEQDTDFLAARLVTPEIAERVSRPGSHARKSFKSTSDGSAHKDLLLYEYTKNIGGDAGVIRLNSADFNAYAAAHSATVLYRGLGSSESTHDLRSGTHFAGEGVYGSGAYASNKKYTAQHSYASGNAANVTRLVMRPGTKSIEYGDLYFDMLESVVKGSSDRVDYMAKLGMAPAMASIRTPGAANRYTSGMSRSAQSSLQSQFGSSSNNDDYARAALLTQFYENKGFVLSSVTYSGGRYGGSNETVLMFKNPNKPGETYIVRVTIPAESYQATSRSRKRNAGKNWDPVVDFSTATRSDTSSDESVARTATSRDAFVRGFSSPQEVMRFLSAVDPRFKDKTLFASKPDKANAKTEEEANALIEKSISDSPELTTILGQTARLEFIQDVGRYALAAGYDWYTIRQGAGEDYIVITNRNAMVMSR